MYLVKKNPELPADGNNWIVMNSFQFINFVKTPERQKRKAFFEAYEQTKLIPPKVTMKTDQLLRQFLLTGGFEVDMP